MFLPLLETNNAMTVGTAHDTFRCFRKRSFKPSVFRFSYARLLFTRYMVEIQRCGMRVIAAIYAALANLKIVKHLTNRIHVLTALGAALLGVSSVPCTTQTVDVFTIAGTISSLPVSQ
jgi:hypothetical protein